MDRERDDLEDCRLMGDVKGERWVRESLEMKAKWGMRFEEVMTMVMERRRRGGGVLGVEWWG